MQVTKPTKAIGDLLGLKGHGPYHVSIHEYTSRASCSRFLDDLGSQFGKGLVSPRDMNAEGPRKSQVFLEADVGTVWSLCGTDPPHRHRVDHSRLVDFREHLGVGEGRDDAAKEREGCDVAVERDRLTHSHPLPRCRCTIHPAPAALSPMGDSRVPIARTNSAPEDVIGVFERLSRFILDIIDGGVPLGSLQLVREDIRSNTQSTSEQLVQELPGGIVTLDLGAVFAHQKQASVFGGHQFFHQALGEVGRVDADRFDQR